MTRYFIALATAFLLLAPAAAANQQTSAKGAYVFVTDLGRWAVAVMQSDRLSQSGRHALLGKLLMQRMDFDTLARHSLGSFAGQASEQEFEEFTNYFAAHFIDLALDRFADMPIVGFAAVKLLRQGDGDVVVVTRIVKDERKPLVAGWRVRARDGEYRIVDVLVEGGNSLALHFRNQYEPELTKHGIRSLIGRLRRLTTGSPTVTLVHQSRGD
ncbi:MAG: phospholipid-binding protein MlaC [Kiloniellales bacterium]